MSKINEADQISQSENSTTFRSLFTRQLETFSSLLLQAAEGETIDFSRYERECGDLFRKPISILRQIIARSTKQDSSVTRETLSRSPDKPCGFGVPPLLESARLSLALSSVTDAVFITDSCGLIVYANKAAEELCALSWKEIAGKPVCAVVSLMDETTLEPCSFNPEEFDGVPHERRCIQVNGETAFRSIEIRTQRFGTRDDEEPCMVFIMRDLSQQDRLEEELFKTRKLESVGMLAGGIAHDFNNILTGIITNLFMARMSSHNNEETCQLIADAEKAAFKATRLTKQLLTFSQNGAPVKERIVISQLIEETVGFSLSGSNVDYHLDLADNLWEVEIDKGQIDQVVNNLVLNAAQAMPDGGTVTISAENCTLTGKTSLDIILPGTKATFREGDYVRISVADEGPGIPRKHMDKIFDPYFTTKKGSTGLGLTSAYSIIKKHGGYIKVESQQGAGASFTLYLPAVSGETIENEGEPADCVPDCGKVLVMDDDVIIRTVVEKLLKKSGYTVECVTNGTEALRSYEEAHKRNDPFQFVIMDLTIPGGMGGKETVVKLKELDKNAKVIVFSGYSTDPILVNFEEYGFDGVLKKPFSTEELMQLLKTINTKNV